MASLKRAANALVPSSSRQSHTAGSAGTVGYDNPRENIDPHVKTKVITASEGTIQHTPSNDKDIANKKYVDDNVVGTSDHSALTNLEWSNASHTMDQNLNMNTNKIVGLVDPVDNQDAATKKYVDDNSGSVDGTIIKPSGVDSPGVISGGSFSGGQALVESVKANTFLSGAKVDTTYGNIGVLSGHIIDLRKGGTVGTGSGAIYTDYISGSRGDFVEHFHLGPSGANLTQMFDIRARQGLIPWYECPIHLYAGNTDGPPGAGAVFKATTFKNDVTFALDRFATGHNRIFQLRHGFSYADGATGDFMTFFGPDPNPERFGWFAGDGGWHSYRVSGGILACGVLTSEGFGNDIYVSGNLITQESRFEDGAGGGAILRGGGAGEDTMIISGNLIVSGGNITVYGESKFSGGMFSSGQAVLSGARFHGDIVALGNVGGSLVQQQFDNNRAVTTDKWLYVGTVPCSSGIGWMAPRNGSVVGINVRAYLSSTAGQEGTINWEVWKNGAELCSKQMEQDSPGVGYEEISQEWDRGTYTFSKDDFIGLYQDLGTYSGTVTKVVVTILFKLDE